MSETVLITGHTYPVRDQLKALGGRWDAAAKGWRVPAERASEARALAGDWGPLPDGSIEVHVGEGYGGIEHAAGEVLRAASAYGHGAASHLVRAGAVAGTYWTVTHCRGEYVRADGMSFGVGDECGYIWETRLRPATEAETAPVRAAEEASARKRAAKALLGSFWQPMWRDGTYDRPEASEAGGRSWALQGDEIPMPGEARNLYGGGRWFVLDEPGGRIWLVQNNGRDGDDWSRNNVRTGGAGAIGRWVPWDAEFAARIRELAAAAGGGSSDE